MLMLVNTNESVLLSNSLQLRLKRGGFSQLFFGRGTISHHNFCLVDHSCVLRNISGVKAAVLKQTSSLSQVEANTDKYIEEFIAEHPTPATPASLLLAGFGQTLTLI